MLKYLKSLFEKKEEHLPEPEIGSLWILQSKQGDPWFDWYLKIEKVKNGFVLYSYPNHPLAGMDSMSLHTLLSCYEPFTPESKY